MGGGASRPPPKPVEEEEDDEDSMGSEWEYDPPQQEDIYTGTKNKSGQYHGKGRLQYKNGDLYDGGWRKGLRHGVGVFVWGKDKAHPKRTGAVYEGTFRKGKMHGKGVLRFRSSAEYRGYFRAGRYHGKGRYRFANSEVYAGQFHEGQVQGAGEFLSRSSTRTRGDLKEVTDPFSMHVEFEPTPTIFADAVLGKPDEQLGPTTHKAKREEFLARNATALERRFVVLDEPPDHAAPASFGPDRQHALEDCYFLKPKLDCAAAAKIVTSGGTAQRPGFRQRLQPGLPQSVAPPKLAREDGVTAIEACYLRDKTGVGQKLMKVVLAFEDEELAERAATKLWWGVRGRVVPGKAAHCRPEPPSMYTPHPKERMRYVRWGTA